MNDRTLFSITEARVMLGGICRNTIYDLMRNGELASVVIGARRFVSREAITAFIAKSTTTTSPAIEPTRFRKPDQSLLPLPIPPAVRSRRRTGNGE